MILHYHYARFVSTNPAPVLVMNNDMPRAWPQGGFALQSGKCRVRGRNRYGTNQKLPNKREVFGFNYNQKLVPIKPLRWSLVAMAVAAVNRSIFCRLKRKFGYLRSTLSALPVSLEHRARRKILIWLTWIEGHRLSPRFPTCPSEVPRQARDKYLGKLGTKADLPPPKRQLS